MKIIFDKPKNDVVCFDDIGYHDYYIVVIDKYNNILGCVVENLELNDFRLINLATSEILCEGWFDSYKSIIEYYKSRGYDFEVFLKYKDLINFLNEKCE